MSHAHMAKLGAQDLDNIFLSLVRAKQEAFANHIEVYKELNVCRMKITKFIYPVQ